MPKRLKVFSLWEVIPIWAPEFLIANGTSKELVCFGLVIMASELSRQAVQCDR